MELDDGSFAFAPVTERENKDLLFTPGVLKRRGRSNECWICHRSQCCHEKIRQTVRC